MTTATDDSARLARVEERLEEQNGQLTRVEERLVSV